MRSKIVTKKKIIEAVGPDTQACLRSFCLRDLVQFIRATETVPELSGCEYL